MQYFSEWTVTDREKGELGAVRHPSGHNKGVVECGVSGAEASYNRVLFTAGALGRDAGMTYTIITKMALISGFIRPHSTDGVVPISPPVRPWRDGWAVSCLPCLTGSQDALGSPDPV